jgi:hypothetical protein
MLSKGKCFMDQKRIPVLVGASQLTNREKTEKQKNPVDFMAEACRMAAKDAAIPDLAYATASLDKDIGLIKNRYINSCNYLDSQFKWLTGHENIAYPVTFIFIIIFGNLSWKRIYSVNTQIFFCIFQSFGVSNGILT